MARSEDQITRDMTDSIEASDNTLDTVQGPIPDVMIRPQAGQLAIASTEAEELRQLFTLEFQEAATDDEVRTALANYGSSPGEGRRSRHTQFFLRFTTPTEDIEIPAGTLVSNNDSSLVYRVVNSGTILASSASAFFNPARNAFEIGLLVEAVGVGPEFDLPRFRIDTLVTDVFGIDATENRTRSRGGAELETKDAQAERLKTALLGRNFGAPGGIEDRIKNALPETVTDVAIIQPFEKEFRRIVEGPALDVYSIGSIVETARQTFTAVGGQTQVVLDRKPVTSITTVTIDGVVDLIDSTLVKDTSEEFGSSLLAQDILVFDSPLTAGSVVVIDYEFNAVLEEIRDEVFNGGEDFLFGSDFLLRIPFVINPRISGPVKALPSFSPDEVQTNVLAFLETEFNFTTFQTLVLPETIRQRVVSEVSGVQSFTLTEFRRAVGALADIEPLTFARNEISQFDTSFINVEVTR